MKYLKKYYEDINFDDIVEEEFDSEIKVGDFIYIDKNLYKKYSNWTRVFYDSMINEEPLEVTRISKSRNDLDIVDIKIDNTEHTYFIPLEMCKKYNK